jgi:hypothetical protein
LIHSFDNLADQRVARGALVEVFSARVIRVDIAITLVSNPRQSFVTPIPFLSDFQGKSDST